MKRNYPCILDSGAYIWLAYDHGNGIALNDNLKKYEGNVSFDSDPLKGVTADYLRGAYGKVGSKKHAEFIVKLAESAGFALDNKFDLSIYNCYFVFRTTEDNAIRLGFYSRCAAVSRGEKLITLPLPPKESEEWPQVGDKVLTTNDYKLEVRGFDGVNVWCLDSEGDYLTFDINELKKPPAQEEELESKIDKYLKVELSEPLIRNLTRAIINGEIKGLSYKPD